MLYINLKQTFAILKYDQAHIFLLFLANKSAKECFPLNFVNLPPYNEQLFTL
ncbi:hypothetical protein HMPREF1053_0500 [Haemophilus haemolyticus HK386]|nr:hypothetical protein HMPREF1053_0500 [Haemophilus haemolyticus HK386]